jgi:hypothetical protein
MSPQYVKINTHYIHPNPWLSKTKLTSYALQDSYNSSHTCHGSPTPSPLTKNRALFASTPTFVISIMLVPKETSQPLLLTKLSMIVLNMRPCPSWMGSMTTIRSKSIQQISIKPYLPPHGVLFLIVSCLLDSIMLVLRSNEP